MDELMTFYSEEILFLAEVLGKKMDQDEIWNTYSEDKVTQLLSKQIGPVEVYNMILKHLGLSKQQNEEFFTNGDYIKMPSKSEMIITY